MDLAPAALTATVGLAATGLARSPTITARLAAVRTGCTLTVTARSLTITAGALPIAARGPAILTRTIITARGRAIIATRSLTVAARFGARFAAGHMAKSAGFAFF